MNLDPTKSRHVVTLPAGRAAVFTDGMDRPIRVAVPLGEHTEDARLASRTPAITAVRSRACARDCWQQPCSLRQITTAEQLAADPRITIWVELAVIAHLIGEAPPEPDPDWLAQLRSRFAHRLLECAIAHRIQTAINDRYTGLAAFYPPEALAGHLATTLHTALDGKPLDCDGGEVQWYAGCYRWTDILNALRTDPVRQDRAHPDTYKWAERGLVLTALTIPEQLEQLRAHPDTWTHPPTVIAGTTSPSVLGTAVAALSPDPDPEKRWRDATAHLHLAELWPLDVDELGTTTTGGRP